MNTTVPKLSQRMFVIDALRGFALVSIILLHNIERFEVYYFPTHLPQWLNQIDKIVWDTFFFIFGGKSYAIFALLFGLTFYIQITNQEKSGQDFRLRFLWRLLLLFGFGFINTLFYQGEILVLYALVGVLIIPFAHLSNRVIFLFALFFLFQPILWIKVIYALNHPDMTPAEPAFMPYYMKVDEFLKGDSMFALIKSNITTGRIASLLWYWEYDRVEQSLGLFLLGYLAGRNKLFAFTEVNIAFWKKTLLISALLFIPLFILKTYPEYYSTSKIVGANISAIIGMWSNLAFMLVLVASFLLLYYTTKIQKQLNLLSIWGKMSLTNYILQSILGSFVYYGFGLAAYKYVGSTMCLGIGILMVIAQGLFCKYWLQHHKRGPLEELWHRLTWIGTDKK
ncbi:MAG: DUF418 domain-containing protein [Cytophagaceae bacterium]